jgi:hypothetical protein
MSHPGGNARPLIFGNFNPVPGRFLEAPGFASVVRDSSSAENPDKRYDRVLFSDQPNSSTSSSDP